MKKTLLTLVLASSAGVTLLAAAPAGELYLLGLNGNNTADAATRFVLGDRDEDDIEEGLWRWRLEDVTVSQTSGTLTISNNADFKLGFDTGNEAGFTNELSNTQTNLYLAPDGPAVNYNLKAGEYSATLVLFEDVYGDMGGDTWMLAFAAKSGADEGSYYLIGFNEVTDPSAPMRFVRTEIEEDGETYYMYTLPHTYISACPDGFTVYDSAADASLGLNPDFASMGSEVTDESPMAFLAAGGENVKCTLKEGYYDVTFAPTGAMSMISFMLSENQTPTDQLDYYLVGANGVTAINDSYKFNRTVEVTEFEDDGEQVRYETVTYTLSGVDFKEAASGLYVVSDLDLVTFGYNTDLAAIMPNQMTADSAFAVMAVNGPAINCTLPEGKYDFTFVITGEGTAMLSAQENDPDAVEMIGGEDAPAEWYDLNGLRVNAPKSGLYIVKRGDKVSKIIVR